jgi:hypothetical protein
MQLLHQATRGGSEGRAPGCGRAGVPRAQAARAGGAAGAVPRAGCARGGGA